MKITQGDVLWLYDDVHRKTGQEHPYIVLSCEEAINQDDFIILVMTTSSGNYNDAFSFPLKDEMFHRPLKRNACQARMHIIISIKVSQIYQAPVNRMKKAYLKLLLKQINQSTFYLDEE